MALTKAFVWLAMDSGEQRTLESSRVFSNVRYRECDVHEGGYFSSGDVRPALATWCIVIQGGWSPPGKAAAAC